MSGARPSGDRPRVDVGVVTWNTAELTATALRRLIDTDQGCELRVLVRDNASDDGTVETLERVVPEAVVEAGTENLGFAAGMNRLIARSDAPWFFALNSDAWPEDGAIARLVAVAEANPRTAAVAPRLIRPDGTLEHSTHPFPSLRVARVMLPRRLRIDAAQADELFLEGAWMHDRPRVVDWAVGAALLITRKALADVGGFDERFFMFAEDLEWCWRARERGWEIRFEPAAVVRHVGNASGRRRYGDRRARAYLLNTYRFYREAHGPVATMTYRGLNLAGSALRYIAALRSRNSEAASYWRGVVRAHVTPPAGWEAKAGRSGVTAPVSSAKGQDAAASPQDRP